MIGLVWKIANRTAWRYQFVKPVRAMALYCSASWLCIVAVILLACAGHAYWWLVAADLAAAALNFGTCYSLIRREHKAER